jgi:mannose-6-phosphate isomerase-like protein (cupin superfamily)
MSTAKPWGHETIWAKQPNYVGKILFVRAGHALSLQSHREKDETIRVLSGVLDFEYGWSGEPLERVRLAPGDGWHVAPGMRHRLTALTDSEVLEVSTPQLDDVVRLETIRRTHDGTANGNHGRDPRMGRTWPSCCSRRATASSVWCGAPAPRTSSALRTCAIGSSSRRRICSTSSR